MPDSQKRSHKRLTQEEAEKLALRVLLEDMDFMLKNDPLDPGSPQLRQIIEDAFDQVEGKEPDEDESGESYLTVEERDNEMYLNLVVHLEK